MRPAAIHLAVRRSKARLLQAHQRKAIFRINLQPGPEPIPLAEQWSGVLHLQAHRLLSPQSPIPHSIVVNNKTRAKNRVNSRRIASSFLLKPRPAAGASFRPLLNSRQCFPPLEPSFTFLETRLSRGVDLAARLPDLRQKYIPQVYNVRVHRTDRTRRLGQAGRLPRIGRVINIQIGREKTLIAKIVAHPRSPGEPVEAAELQGASLKLDY